MKNLLVMFVFAVATTVALVSCNKEDDSEPESMLIGKWKAVSSAQPPGEDGYGGWFVSYEDGLNNLYYEFKSDGTCSGNVAIIELVPVEGNWILGNGKLTIESEEYDMVYDVAKLDASNLILHFRWKPENTVYYELIFKKE
jgi:hypothetical protein